jgi:hypothetical protein
MVDVPGEEVQDPAGRALVIHPLGDFPVAVAISG